MNNEQPIAFFDSGVGGITVFEKLKKILPNENYIYFGDLKNNPYGEKTKAQLLKFTDEIFRFFETKGVKIVVMACNTTSANIFEELKDKYNFKIYPIIQSTASVIGGKCVDGEQPTRIGVLATAATINSGAYARELKKYNPDLEVFEQACPPWVKIVEENTSTEPESLEIIESYLNKMLENKPDKIILGCTHYPYLLNSLKKFAPTELFIDPSEAFANFVKADLEANNMLNASQNSGSEEFFVSANPKRFKEVASIFYPLDKEPTLVDFSLAK